MSRDSCGRLPALSRRVDREYLKKRNKENRFCVRIMKPRRRETITTLPDRHVELISKVDRKSVV